MGFSTVLITFPNFESARSISMALIEKRLAACSNLLASQSIYSWKGAIEETDEIVGLFKIRTEDFQEVRKMVLARHPYDMPCIVRYDIAEGDPTYLNWIKDSTGRHQQDSDRE